jgi:hypothetical protein
MTTNAKVKASVSTHFPNGDNVKVEEQSDASLNNSQDGMTLIDPEDLGEEVSTHSESEPDFKGPATAPVKAKKLKAADAGSAQPLESPAPVEPGNVNIPNDEDPAAGILKTSGEAAATSEDLPVIENASVDEEDDFAEDDLMLASDDDEFDDLAEADADDEFSAVELDGDLDLGDVEDTDDDAGAEMDVTSDFEDVAVTDDDVPLVDVDAVDDKAGDDLVFASIGSSVHVIKSNRIIASMGPKAAAKAGVSEVYQVEQFQDAVQASVDQKGLRKGLVQHGFVLAKVKLTAAKAQARVVEAKVQRAVTARLETLSAQEKVLEQSLAIAAVGINKSFFKGATNELKAGLISELEHAGVRGASRLVRAMFAQHGVDYAKSLLTVAKKISAMPEEVRDNYVTALDMTDGAEVEDEVEIESDVDVGDDEFIEDDEPVMARSVTAALTRPLHSTRQTAALLRASNGDSGAFAILSGTQSLV